MNDHAKLYFAKKFNKPGKAAVFYIDKIFKNLSGLGKDCGEKPIHDFRVAVKKARALMRMLNMNSEMTQPFKFPEEIKKIYRLAGKIRNRQLYIKRFTVIPKSEEKAVHKFTRKLLEKQQDFFCKNKAKKIRKKVQHHFVDRFNLELAKLFIISGFQQINLILNKEGNSSKDVHSIRKYVKDIVYVSSIANDDLSVGLPKWYDDKLQKQMGNLAHQLGLFNDATVALRLIKKSSDNKNASLKTRIINERKKIKTIVLDELKGIIQTINVHIPELSRSALSNRNQVPA